MKSFIFSLILALGASSFLVAVPVEAQNIPYQAIPSADTVLPALPTFSGFDAIADHDRALYELKDIASTFKIAFKPHIRVCDAAPAGEARCHARIIADGTGHANTFVAPAGYGPAQLLGAYSLSGFAMAATSSQSGTPIIAIVDAYDDPYIANDLATYSSTFGLPKLPKCSGSITNSSIPCFQKVNQYGSTTAHPSGNSGWALEIALDVETAHAICQNCRILLVEANSASYANLMTAVDRAVLLGAHAISNSYGSNEFPSETSFDSHLNHPGIAITFSAGDGGYGAEYPAASPYVTAVGGTSLFLHNDNSYNSESAWSGTGSGCSAYEPKPIWQTDTGCAHRTIADVSADADPNTGAAIYDSYAYYGQRGWFQVGGTSLAAPIIAGVYALSGHIPAATQENSLPYLVASSTSALHDITAGSNGVCDIPYLCTALPGYDGPTGLGSPLGTVAF